MLALRSRLSNLTRNFPFLKFLPRLLKGVKQSTFAPWHKQVDVARTIDDMHAQCLYVQGLMDSLTEVSPENPVSSTT